MSLGQLVVDYQMLPNPGGMFGGTLSVVAGSWISHQLGTEEISRRTSRKSRSIWG
jgi:hypothetical protein